MSPRFFSTQLEFRKWLEANHNKETEILVGFYKVASGKQSITWSQSVDEALCFGWIDGVRRGIDANSYCIRFTPRKPTSNWSAVNIKKVEMLTQQGLMKPEGIACFKSRKVDKSIVYSYENKPEKLSDEFEAKFKENAVAWKFFELQATWYKKTSYYWIMSAKQEITKANRLNKLIKACEEGQKLF